MQPLENMDYGLSEAAETAKANSHGFPVLGVGGIAQQSTHKCHVLRDIVYC